MKTAMLVCSLLAVFLTGCSRPIIRETKETVIERKTETPAPAVAARSCMFASTAYSHGSVSCQSGYQFQCNDGAWTGINRTC